MMKLILGFTVTAAMIAYPILWKASARVIQIDVEERERIVTGHGESLSSRYVVFAKQGEFEVTDTWLFWDFRSSTRYAKLKKGASCSVKVAGWRAGFLSWYPNVVEVKNCGPVATANVPTQ